MVGQAAAGIYNAQVKVMESGLSTKIQLNKQLNVLANEYAEIHGCKVTHIDKKKPDFFYMKSNGEIAYIVRFEDVYSLHWMFKDADFLGHEIHFDYTPNNLKVTVGEWSESSYIDTANGVPDQDLKVILAIRLFIQIKRGQNA